MKNRYNLALCLFVLSSLNLFGQWEHINSPYGKLDVYQIEQRDSVLFAATSCGLFTKKTSDNAWQSITRGTITNFRISNDTLFTSYYNQSFGYVNLRQTPFTYNPVYTNTPSYTTTPQLAFHNNLTFLTSSRGVNLSYDRGLNSQPYISGLDMDTVVSGVNTYYNLDVYDVEATANYVFCATAKGVYRSDFGLAGWLPKGSGLNGSVITKIFKFNSGLYALANDTLYKSLNNGDNWSALYGGAGASLSDFYELNGSQYLISATIGVLVSTNNGSSWQVVNNGLSGIVVTDVEFLDSAITVFGSEGVFVWNGVSWQPQIQNGLFCGNTASIQASSAGVTITDWYGVFKLNTDDTYDDITPRKAFGWVYGLSMVNNDTLYVPARYDAFGQGVDSSKIFKSSNNGASWSAVNGPVFSSAGIQVNTDIRMHNDTIYLMGDNQLFYSSNFGKTWVDISPVNIGCNIVNDILILNGQLFMTGCSIGGVFKLDKGTNTWARDFGFVFRYSYYFMKRDSVVFITAQDDIQRKYLPTGNWQQATGGLNQFNVYSHLNLNQNLFITTSVGVFKTEDYGDNWIDYNTGWSDPTDIHPVNIAVFGDTMYVGSFFQGLYKQAIPPNPISLNEFSSADGIIKLYPNPASDHVRITSEKEGQGTYKIYDQSGKLMMEGEFINGEYIGVYQLNAGMYIVKLIQGKISSEQKLLIK